MPGAKLIMAAFRIARSTRDSAFSFTKASTQTRAPFGSAISTSSRVAFAAPGMLRSFALSGGAS